MSRSAVETEPGSRQPPGDDQAFFGRPRGPRTPSDLEVRGRFSFLGMRAIPVPRLSDTVAHGGTGVTAGTAVSARAAYGTLVRLVSVAGGRLADRNGGFAAAAIRVTFGLIPYVAGRRHLAGPGHAAECARAP